MTRIPRRERIKPSGRTESVAARCAVCLTEIDSGSIRRVFGRLAYVCTACAEDHDKLRGIPSSGLRFRALRERLDL